MPKKLTIAFGAIFILVGLLGFIPNPIIGVGSFFEANAVHNAVHLVGGIILLLVAFFLTGMSSMALRAFGIMYPVIAVLGFVLNPQGGDLLGFVATNVADHWLHVVLGIVLFGSSFIS